MSVLNNLEPERVFYYFEEICKIPHGSYNLQKISDFLVQFAKDHNLEWYQDAYLNVIINKVASPGYESEPVIMIQGHMDMVAVQDKESTLDLQKQGLILQKDDSYIWAEHTSLGGDDGIAVAYALAILESDTIKHPPIQAIFTTNEEVGMDGAIGLDPVLLRGSRMLNIDSEEEGILTVGCAGGTKILSHLPVQRETLDDSGLCYEIAVGGLQGGHSGTMIHLGRANGNVVLGRLLNHIWSICPFHICLLEGGEKSNAIPLAAKAVVQFDIAQDDAPQIIQKIKQEIAAYENALKKEFFGKDEGIFITFQPCDFKAVFMEAQAGQKEAQAGQMEPSANKLIRSALTLESGLQCIKMLLLQPDGVIARSGSVEGLVETSLNLGIMKLEEDFCTTYEVRSSLKHAKTDLTKKVIMLAQTLGASCEILGDYPSWEFNSDSVLQGKMVSIYQQMFGCKPVVNVIHAGLECGVFAEKIEGFDAVSFGPNILDIHTTNERLDIASVKRVWDYLIQILETK